MIVPSKRRFFGAERFAPGVLKVGDTFSIDSHMGGSWTVVYTGVNQYRGGLVFHREKRPDWPAESWTFADEAEAAKNLFILIPEDPNLRGTEGGDP